MAVKKDGTQWLVDIRPHGAAGKRVRKRFDTKGEALRFEAHTKHQAIQQPWNTTPDDTRKLSEIIERWHTVHGQTLKRGNARRSYLLNLALIMGNPRASTITAKTFANFRSLRLESVSANTVNHDLAYLKALFNELIRLGEWRQNNPFANIRKIKIDEKEMAYLTPEQIKTVLHALDSAAGSHAGLIARVCLSTGARWSEAATLQRSQLNNRLITFTGTKNSKSRSVPVSPELFAQLEANAPLVDGYSALKRTFAKLDLNLPTGQLSHVFRHTFASHFMMNGGNIITLQRILGHASLQMTMKYAHFSPDHFSDAVKFNPLANLSN